MEVSNLLSLFLEENSLDIKEKQEIIMACFNTLNELSTGLYENQKIICQNKRLFTFINEKIIMKDWNFE